MTEISILEPPWLVPVPIPTKGKSRWAKFKTLFATRYYCLGRTWYYLNSREEKCIIPGAFDADGKLKDIYFVTDGKSYPRICRVLMNSMGVGLNEGLIHDFAYRYLCQILADGTVIRYAMSRKVCDRELEAVGILTNHMAKVSAISYRLLRIGGYPAWRKHRDRDGTRFNDVSLLIENYEPQQMLEQAPTQKPALMVNDNE